MVRRSHKFGVDANRPVVVEAGPRLGALADTVVDPAAIAESGVAWVRLNFVLGPWLEHRDTARFQGRTWAETYRVIIDRFLDRGLNIYGLVGHEAVKPLPDFFRDPKLQTPFGDTATAQTWIARYAETFADIVALYADRVTVFEAFNEPDAWHGAFRPWIHPSWFAEMLEAVHRKVKVEMGAHPVKLISGPLQGLEVNENRAPTQYLRETYQYGCQYLGWGQPDRPYPFDGIGYHLYVKEAYNPDWADQEYQVRQLYRRYVDGMMRVIRAAEGPDATRQLYISEVGWPSNRDTPEEKAFQANNLRLAFELMQADPAVALAIWFCTEDFEPGRGNYGLYQMRRVTPDGRKPAFHYLKAFCERFGAGVVQGTLRDEAGSPASGYQITISGATVTGSVVTGRNGGFRFDSLPTGGHRLSVVGTGVSRLVDCDGHSTVTLDLVLPLIQPLSQGVIAGALRDQLGAPQLGRQITLSGQGRTLSVTTDAVGAYRFDGLAVGAYTLGVVGADLTRHVWSNGITPVVLDLVLPAASAANRGVISGTLRDRLGVPQVARRITALGPLLARTVSTDGGGQYRCEALPAGVYAVYVEGSELSQSVYCDGSSPVSLDLTLPAAPTPARGVVSGVLRDQAGEVLVGRKIVLELLNAGLTRSSDTDSQGRYRFDSLPAGSYRISVTGTDVAHTVWMDGVAHAVIDLAIRALAMQTGVGGIGGVLRNGAGLLQVGRHVTLIGGGLSRATFSGADGAYKFDGLPDGTYLLSVPAAGVMRYVWSNGQTPVLINLVVNG